MTLFEFLGEHLLQHPPTPIEVITWIAQSAGTSIAFLSCLFMATLVVTTCPTPHSGLLLMFPVLAGLGWPLHGWAFRVLVARVNTDWSIAHDALLNYGNLGESERSRQIDKIGEAYRALERMQGLLQRAGLRPPRT